MSHANAALTPRARLRLARLIVDGGYSVRVAAKLFLVSPPTARKWAARYRAEGPTGMTDRTSRPKTLLPTVKRIVRLRLRHRYGPAQVAWRLGLPASTVHAVLVRCRINRLSCLDRIDAEPVRRYEHDYPGSLIHVDVTKFGRIPDGGGHRFLGRAAGARNRQATAARTGARNATRHPRLGTAFVHTVIDDHSRLAYAEIHDDEQAVTAIGVLQRAVDWFNARGVTVKRVLCDNGSAYRSYTWKDACQQLGITRKRTRPYRPQTNGKVERFHRTLGDGWAYARLYESDTERCQQLPAWLNHYNHHRFHSAIGTTSISRIENNLPGHHT